MDDNDTIILQIRHHYCMGWTEDILPEITQILFDKEKGWRINRIWNDVGCIEKSEGKPIDKSEIEPILAKLKKAKIPIFVDPDLGCDGSITELEIGDYFGKAHYSWWCNPPNGWKMLQTIVEEIYSIAEFHNLPNGREERGKNKDYQGNG